jgi:hypothetical protein
MRERRFRFSESSLRPGGELTIQLNTSRQFRGRGSRLGAKTPRHLAFRLALRRFDIGTRIVAGETCRRAHPTREADRPTYWSRPKEVGETRDRGPRTKGSRLAARTLHRRSAFASVP